MKTRYLTYCEYNAGSDLDYSINIVEAESLQAACAIAGRNMTVEQVQSAYMFGGVRVAQLDLVDLQEVMSRILGPQG